MDGTNSVTPFRGARTHETRYETAHSDYGDPCTKALFANQSFFQLKWALCLFSFNEIYLHIDINYGILSHDPANILAP